MKLSILDTFTQVQPARWDALMASCAAPIFYHSSFVQAFEQFPLHAIERCFYLLWEEDDGELLCAFPAYLLHGVDPMRVLADYFPKQAGERLLLSHNWHVYDSWLPAHQLSVELVKQTISALQQLALSVGAAVFGFANVEAEGPLAQKLSTLGIQGITVDRRFLAQLSNWADFEGYLAGLGKKERSNMRRYLNRAVDAQVCPIVREAREADLDGFVELARATAEKYHNADYYQRGLFQNFVRALGPRAQLIEIHYQGKLVGSAILLCDERRIHFWVCGVEYSAIPKVSTFYLAYMTSLQHAFSRRVAVFECGRRNESFKVRYGMTGREVQAYLLPVHTRLA